LCIIRPQTLENSKCEENIEQSLWKYINDTFSLNESRNSPDCQNKYDMLNDFMTPIESKFKIDTKEDNDAPQLSMHALKEVMSPVSKNYDSPLLFKYTERWNTVRRNNK